MTNEKKRRGDYGEQWTHIEWVTLIRATKDYCVFIDEEGDLDWETTREYDKKREADAAYDRSQENAILNEAALLETTPCEGLTEGFRAHFKRLIGEAICCCLNQDFPGGLCMIEAAGKYVKDRSAETSRFWYVSASFAATAPFLAIGIVLWLEREFYSALLTPNGLWVCLAVSAGALGALLSVIIRSGSIQVDCSAGRRLHYLEATSRIAAGGISALVVSLAVSSEMILAPLFNSAHPHAALILAALAAGTGERMVGSIISSLENGEGTSDENSKKDDGAP